MTGQVALPLSALHESLLRLPEIQKRFWNKVEKTPTCWLWRGARNHDGYGRFSLARRLVIAARVAFFLEHGFIDPRLTVDHIKCDNPPCVRASHLRQCSKRENTLRGKSVTAREARQTTCKSGHPLTADNTYTPSKHPTWRKCRKCREKYREKWRESA